MKILIVGEWQWPQYEAAFARGLKEQGAVALKLSIGSFFLGFLGRYQHALPVPGARLFALNRKVIDEVTNQQPDWVLFWRPTHILPRTLKLIQSQGVRTASYNNDDPFGPEVHGNCPWHHHWHWHWYLKCLPLFSRNFFYRQINCDEARRYGVRHAEVLMPYFRPWHDRKMSITESERNRYKTDVVFVGHYEPDGRVHSIRALMNAGIKTKIWGGHYWNRSVLGDLYEQLAPITKAEGVDYTKALCGAKICLCFLSKLNRDNYTRRCFEIPACGQVMLSERTSDLKRLFKEDEEACFFSSNEELVDKAQWLLSNPEVRERIALGGLRRVLADGHDVTSRARDFLATLDE